MAGLVAACGYVGSVLWMLDKRRGGTICVFVILVASFCSLVLSRGGVGSGALVLVSQVRHSRRPGRSRHGMLLGHWYLTAPTMSIDPLKRLSLLFGIAVIFATAGLCRWLAAGGIESVRRNGLDLVRVANGWLESLPH